MIRHRMYHTSAVLRGDETDETTQLSAKEKKKLLKAKAKAAMAEKGKEDENEAAGDDSSAKKSDETKAELATKKEAAASANDDGSSSSSDSSDDEKEDSPTEVQEEPASGTPDSTTPKGAKEYSYPELTADAARHKEGMNDPTRPDWQNPLHHNNPDMQKIFPEDFDTPEEFEKAILPAPPVDPGDGSVVAPPYMHELVDEIVHLTMLEYNELINKIADHYGFHESDLAPDDGDDDDDGGDGGGGAAPAEEKTAFDVKLVSFDAKAKIKIIKEVRTIVAGLGLKEAKAMVEGAPVVLQKGMKKEDADQVKAKLEELGAVIEVE